MYKEVEEMSKNEEKEELAKLFTKLFPFDEIKGNCDRYDSFSIAKEVLDLGYRKQVWHKVSDGDLPSNTDDIVVVGRFGSTFCAFYDNEVKRFFVHTCTIGYSLKDIIAWTELPKYEE